MLLLSLILFIGLFIGLTFGVEYLLPPYGKFYYTDVLDILTSFATDISLKLNISQKSSFIIVGIGMAIIPLFITIFFNVKFRKKTRGYKYKLK